LIREIPAVSGTIGELLAAACQRYRGRLALVRGDETRSYCELLDHGARVATALRELELPLLVTIGAERPPGSMDFDELVTSARSVVQITARADGDLAIVGYTSGTTGLPKGAMISQRALTDCVRLMPSMFRISSYGRCAFTGTLSLVSGIWGVILPHLYTGGTVTFLHPYTPESWVDHIEADQSTFTYALNASLKVRKDRLRAELGRREAGGTGAGESS
jgi:acyl-coenzyme A synthetase/AMP-(fatty) acid ligase